MILDKWKKKPSKKELFDIIKIQEEEISRLNKEKMNFNIVIRNEKPIRIDTQGLDYMVDLEQKYYDLQSIKKEVREYIETQIPIVKAEMGIPNINTSTSELLNYEKILGILDKESKK